LIELSETAAATGPSDAELIEAVRGGQIQAYGQLYTRHVQAAHNLARQLSRSPIEADDLVSDAFAKVLATLRAGGGPDTAFRAYLLTALRHTAYDKTRRDRKLELVDDIEAVSRGEQVPFDDPAVAQLDRSLAVRAFSSLPERWQTVLWHTAIERQSPKEVAPMLGLTSNGVSAMAYRAREGLRKAFLQAHVTDNPSERCQAASAKLGSWTRDGLSKLETAQVEAHLDKCDACRALAAELADVNGALRGVVAPLVLGVGTAGYLAAGAGKASAAVSIAASSGSVLPWLGAAASTAALVIAITTGVPASESTIGPSAVAEPPTSSTTSQTAAPTSSSNPTAADTVPPPATTAPPAREPSAVAPPSTANPTNTGAAAPVLTPTAPATFTTSTGGPPTRLPITFRNTGSAPSPPMTLTLSLPDDVKVVGPGNNLLGAPLLRLGGAQQTIGCPAGKGTVVCTATQELAPGESLTFAFRLLAGPKATGGTMIATTNSARPLRVEIPVIITPKK
jgi:RNA polymerase sigma factor (sigma-70 family)